MRFRIRDYVFTNTYSRIHIRLFRIRVFRICVFRIRVYVFRIRVFTCSRMRDPYSRIRVPYSRIRMRESIHGSVLPYSMCIPLAVCFNITIVMADSEGS